MGVVITISIVNAKRVISVCKGRRVVRLADVIVDNLTIRVNNVQGTLTDGQCRTSWSSYAWIMAKNKESDKASYASIHERTKSFVDFAEARAVVVAPIETTIGMCRIAMVDWDICIYKVTL
jgi:hypothetical protein